jgi:ankyrin repeat protein
MELPKLPFPIDQFLHEASKCRTQKDIHDLTKPYKEYEAKLRGIYAQHPDHPAAKDNHLVPVFADGSPAMTIRARDLDKEPNQVKDQYLLALSDDQRKTNGTAATVKDLASFKTNLNIFSESSLADLDWSNVIAAGSSVVTALLPVNKPHNESKRALRAYYHETLAPASDVDLFLYGLNEEQAIEKIKQIESNIRDSILSETTTIRTKNAITIVSEYPCRMVQIVLRLYSGVSEILTGFDVDCSCVAYDGKQVWASPRGLSSFLTQVNTIDLTRRSPSYENRLSKYSHRGFEAHWPGLDRDRVDPTIFERSFSRVLGLARLLVLEKLPHPNDRDTYLAKRRAERGRPELSRDARYRHQLPGNVKDAQPDDVAEWVQEDEVSNYHTFTIPYGPKYNPKRIEKLLFTKDLLLNAEWNRPKDRETHMHRHPAFFGRIEDVLGDCCGYCPQPKTDEDLAAAEEENKIYVSGKVEFLKDDPGRQAIGSFHPLTDDDWVEMAYIGNTARLCQAIVDKDLEGVSDWFESGELEQVDVNRRDHAGRTPLQLATMSSTPEIVQFLIDHGARIVSRIYSGFTALHIAAWRGEVEMVKALLEKSAANEKEEDKKEEARKEARRTAAKISTSAEHKNAVDSDDSESESEDIDEIEDEDEDKESDDVTEGSFVKVSNKEKDNVVDDDEDAPDIYDIDVLSWDSPLSPLHLSIIAGRTNVVELLIKEYGADVLLPVKILSSHDRTPESAILTLILALQLPLAESKHTINTLLSNGAMGTQADMKQISALHYAVSEAKPVILKTLQQRSDATALGKAMNFLVTNAGRYGWYDKSVDSPLLTSIRSRRAEVVESVLDWGAKPEISLEAYSLVYQREERYASADPEQVKTTYQENVEQPVIVAAKMEMPKIVLRLIDMGANVNSCPTSAYRNLRVYSWGMENKSLLDLVQDRLKDLRESLIEKARPEEAPEKLDVDDHYTKYHQDSYQRWFASHDLEHAKHVKRIQMSDYQSENKAKQSEPLEGEHEKKEAVKSAIVELEDLEHKLQERGAKSFKGKFDKFPTFLVSCIRRSSVQWLLGRML